MKTICVGCGKPCRGKNWEFVGRYPAHNDCKDAAQTMIDEDEIAGLNFADPDIIPFPVPHDTAA